MYFLADSEIYEINNISVDMFSNKIAKEQHKTLADIIKLTKKVLFINIKQAGLNIF